MLGIIRIALQRPLTFIVMAVLILIFGGLAAIKTPADIFPDIKVPAIAVAWQYTGLSANDMARADHDALRADHLHTGQRHRAHREHVDRGHRHLTHLLPA
ncbi:MAG: efflux RND transporter permease subunit [Caulobacteraceae bacterium]